MTIGLTRVQLAGTAQKPTTQKSVAQTADTAPTADIVQKSVAQTADPAQKWDSCRACGALVYLPRVRRMLGVCPECGHHRRVPAHERLAQLLDEGSFTPAGDHVVTADPLTFTDSVPYPRRVSEARGRSGLEEAAVRGTGTLGGHRISIVVLDFAFMGGSMGSAAGEIVTRAAECARDERVPLLIVTASGGARMQEGCLSLMQMAKTSQAIARLREIGVPSICLLTDPTFGGVTASFGTLADVLIAERGSLIGFAGPRVIRNAMRQELPPGFQKAEALHAHGMVDRVESREAVRPVLARLLALLSPGRVAGRERPAADVPAVDVPAPDVLVRDVAAVPRRAPMRTVRLARDIGRPTTLDYIRRICDDFAELSGDRCYGDDPAVVGGPAVIRGVNVMLIGHQKGHTTQERVARNFGMPNPEGYRKALRLMKLAERLGLPVVTLIDTPGANPGIGAEERGQALAIAETIAASARLTVPVVATITGEGGSGGALALAVADRVLMLENSCYSVISPESCSTILAGEESRVEAMAAALKLTAPDLLGAGIVDAVVPEPSGGAQADPAQAAATVATAILTALRELDGLDSAALVRDRYDRFRRFGVFSVVPEGEHG